MGSKRMTLALAILIAAMANWMCATTEQTHVRLTEEQLRAALRIAPEAMKAINPLLEEASQRRMSALEPGEGAVEKVRYATLVWHDPETQAAIIQANGEALPLLDKENLSPLAFTHAIWLTELVLARSAPDAPSRKELEEEANEIERFYKELAEGKIEGGELAQWQLAPLAEARIQMRIRAWSFDEEDVKLVERNRAYIPDLLTGDTIGDWLIVRELDEVKRRAAASGRKWPPSK